MNKRFLASVRTLAVVLCPWAAPLVAEAYTHPGLPLTSADLATLKANLGRDPWKSGYAALSADSHSQLAYGMQGPFATVSRNPDVNLNPWRNDMIAVWNLSRMWYFTGNTAYAQKAHDILLAWASTQTTFGGGESPLDIGDYAYRFVGGADILRGTWPGWTAADTTTVKAYFGNVLLPATNPVGENLFGAANKGALSLVGGGLLALFNDDTAKVDSIVYQYRSLAHIGLRNSNALGELGDSGRDQGHAHGQFLSLAMFAEALWKQGIDLYSENDSRLLAVGEYYARANYLAPTPYLPFGTTDAYYTSDGTNRGWNGGRLALNLIHGAYVVRKGIKAPYTELRRQGLPLDMDSFMFEKAADPSTASPPAAISFPATASLTTGVSNADIGNATPAGSGSYSGGLWTVQGAGSDIWSTNDNCHFTYKAVTGDFSIVAKVESITGPSASGKAGVMLRESLTAGAKRAWMAVTMKSTVEQNIQGLAVYGGTNYGNKSLAITQSTYWVKLERLGNMVTGYLSPDGTNWAATDVGRYDSIPDTLYVGLVACSVSNGTLGTATFSNVQITGGDGGAPVVTPSAPVALLAAPGASAVPLRWQPSFGAASYAVKRAATSGGPYTTLASGIAGTSYTDTTAAAGTTYYYVVSATNSAGTSANSPEDGAVPAAPMVNVAFLASASASANGSSSTEGAAQGIDLNPGTKWYNGGAGTTGWLQCDFGAGVTQTIKRYAVSSANDTPGRDPKDWQLQGSADGSSWTTLDTRTAQAFTNRYQAINCAIASPAAYRFYRLNITANNGDTAGLQLGELALLTDQGRTVPDGLCRLLNRRSNKALEVQSGSTANGAPLDQWSFNGGDNQKWTLTDTGNGQYQLIGLASGKAIDVSGGSTANGAGLLIWPYSGANNQKWTITPTGDGFFKLTAVHSGKVADVNAGSTADGASIIQWPYGGGDNQQWSVTTSP
ncbi:RICIN domain-containing protein [Luteolibacter sp. LG18]|uniref:RICIN domain-containing protein n=1 Tax=Luteolibacter sp. LG18 TaxID=2819286 RepID=UPI002B2AFCF7|nr:hypothetical protein llg_27520 [Luteolibacter sp. LG18]